MPHVRIPETPRATSAPSAVSLPPRGATAPPARRLQEPEERRRRYEGNEEDRRELRDEGEAERETEDEPARENGAGGGAQRQGDDGEKPERGADVGVDVGRVRNEGRVEGDEPGREEPGPGTHERADGQMEDDDEDGQYPREGAPTGVEGAGGELVGGVEAEGIAGFAGGGVEQPGAAAIVGRERLEDRSSGRRARAPNSFKRGGCSGFNQPEPSSSPSAPEKRWTASSNVGESSFW